MSDISYRRQRGPKIFCSRWLSHGECSFEQQGCKYKHEMPFDDETLESVGHRVVPQWFFDMPRQYQESHTFRRYTSVSNEVEGAGRGNGHVSTANAATHNQAAPPMLTAQAQGDSTPARLTNNDLFSSGGRTFQAEKLLSTLQESYDCLDRHLIAAQAREYEAVLAVTRSKANIQRADEISVDSDIADEMMNLELAAATAKGARAALSGVKADVDACFKAASMATNDNEQADEEAVRYAMSGAR